MSTKQQPKQKRPPVKRVHWKYTKDGTTLHAIGYVKSPPPLVLNPPPPVAIISRPGFYIANEPRNAMDVLKSMLY